MIRRLLSALALVALLVAATTACAHPAVHRYPAGTSMRRFQERGWITDHTSWRWVFYVNLPVGLIALLALAILMPPLRHAQARPRIDVLGALLLIAGLVPALLGLSWNGTLYPWFSWQVLALLSGGLAALALLIVHETRLERRGGEPIIAPSLLASRAFGVSLLTIMIAFMGMVGCMATGCSAERFTAASTSFRSGDSGASKVISTGDPTSMKK